jgi:hypothetical protein
MFEMTCNTNLEPAEPLWKRVPTRDEYGHLLGDFMMIIDGLRSKPYYQIESTIRLIQEILSRYGHHVVFADLNLKLNVLWVSVRPTPGICLELAAAIHAQIPDAKIVAADLFRGKYRRRSY